MLPFIDLKYQYSLIRDEIHAGIDRVLESGHYILGAEIAELEKQLAEYAGVKHALACSSGTDALLMALMALGIGPGDAVFTTPFTFFATVETIALVGATPVFADIDEGTYNIDPAKLEEAILKVEREGKLKPKAIIPVDLFGLTADYKAIKPLADAHGLAIIEDACQAFGAVDPSGKRAPALGTIGCTSFFPSAARVSSPPSRSDATATAARSLRTTTTCTTRCTPSSSTAAAPRTVTTTSAWA